MKTKSKMVAGVVLSVLAVALATGAYAQSQPSAKVTAKVGYINVLSEVVAGTNSTVNSDTGWKNILANNLKTPNQKDAFVVVSLEVGLLTDTLVKSKNGTADTSMATAGVEVRVLIDGNPMLPGKVVFGRRTQTLTATFQGIIDGCLAIDPTTGGIVIDPNCVQPEQLGLILETMNANSFSFIVADLPAGVHTFQVQARINAGASAQQGAARARGLIGNGSVTVESVRMIRNEDIVLE
jgi:hypothetical protein